MSALGIRATTQEEFSRYRQRIISAYAAEHVRTGTWSTAEAEQQAAKQTNDRLPEGADTDGIVLLAGETDGEVIQLVDDASQRARDFALLHSREKETHMSPRLYHLLVAKRLVDLRRRVAASGFGRDRSGTAR